MNPDESLGEVEVDVEEPPPEQKEITVCARLVLSDEQVSKTVPCISHNHLDTFVIFINKKMEDRTLSGTAEYSEEEIDHELQSPPKLNEVKAKLVLNDEQESNLRQAFNLLDYTGEGKIKAEDFRVAIKALGYEPTKEELQIMVNGVDKGSTGKLSFENFETAIMRKIMSLDSDGDIMKSFRLFDIHDNGYISFDNIKQVSEILGCYLTDEEIDEMIDDADTDFDGFVDVKDFMKMIKNSVHIVTP